jgi:hypothetical protein
MMVKVEAAGRRGGEENSNRDQPERSSPLPSSRTPITKLAARIRFISVLVEPNNLVTSSQLAGLEVHV